MADPVTIPALAARFASTLGPQAAAVSVIDYVGSISFVVVGPLGDEWMRCVSRMELESARFDLVEHFARLANAALGLKP